MADDPPATPAQLAANLKAATDGLQPQANPPDAAAKRLQHLLDAVEARLTEWEGLGASAEGRVATLIGAWRRTHLSHREDLSAALVALGAEPGPGGDFGADLRAAGAALRGGLAGVTPAALAPVLQREARLLDLYDVAGGADPDHRHMLDRHRAALVALGNRTQDVIDGIAR